MDERIERTLNALRRNNMQAFYLPDRAAAAEKLFELCPVGAGVTCGGSMTLKALDVYDRLKGGDYEYLDRYAPGADTGEIFRRAFFCDVYITGTNAVTQQGELYNVDGNGNRTAAMIFGPGSVIVVAGINKLVRDMDEAVERVKKIAAPLNAARLEKNTPCVKTGVCEDCRSPERICCAYVKLGWQREKDRIKVLLIGEELGL